MASTMGKNSGFQTERRTRVNGYHKETSMSFQQALTRHLQAVQDHDVETFLETVAQDGSLTMILPNGNLLDNYDEIVELHQEWFADPEWQMTTELINTHESKEMATALLLVNYEDVDEEGEPIQFQYFLSLIFAKQGESWHVIHDQNTLIDIEIDEE